MNEWDCQLRAQAQKLGARLNEAHPSPLFRRRLRRGRIALVVAPFVMGAIITAQLWSGNSVDPVVAIEAQYQNIDRLERLIKSADLDPKTRHAYEEALAAIDRAIVLAKGAVRKAPGNGDYAEICHLTFQAKERLLRTFLADQGGSL